MGKPSEQPESVDDDTPETTEPVLESDAEDAPEPTEVESSASAPADDEDVVDQADEDSDEDEADAEVEASHDDAEDEDEDSDDAEDSDEDADVEADEDAGIDEEPETEPALVAARERTHVRDLTRWHIPFHYAPALVVAAVGIAMLVVGGTVGWFGGWWLAAALPIAIGAFLRSIWFAAIPMVVWGGWLIYAGGADDTADLSNTPTLLGICLGLIGTGATVLAQRAVFPATEPGAWEASVGRIVPPLDDGETSPFDDHTDEHTIELAVVEPIEASEEELEAAAVAAMSDATIVEVPLPDEGASEESPAADATEDDDVTGADGAVAEFKAIEDDRDDEADEDEHQDESDEQDDTSVVADASDEAGETNDEDDADETDDAADAADANNTDPQAEAEPFDDEPADPSGADETDEAASETPVTEASLDADPAELDEGGHPTEFQAITEEDLAKAETSEA